MLVGSISISIGSSSLGSVMMIVSSSIGLVSISTSVGIGEFVGVGGGVFVGRKVGGAVDVATGISGIDVGISGGVVGRGWETADSLCCSTISNGNGFG